MDAGELDFLYLHRRTRSRADCAAGLRPCPLVSCKHHLYLDVHPETGSICIRSADIEVWDMQETCALDLAEQGGLPREEVAALLGLPVDHVRRIEEQALAVLDEGA